LLALRPVTGFFAGGLMPVAMAILGDRYARADRQLAIARFLTVALIGQVAGASGAGLLIAFVGWRGVMWVSAAMAVVAATGALIIFPQSATAPRKPFAFADIVAGYKAVFANPNAWVCFGIVWAEGISIFGVTPFFAEMLESAHQGGAREAGFIIAGVGVGGVVFSLTVGLMLRFLSRRAMMITGGVIGALGLAAIAIDLSWAHDVIYFSCVGFGFFMLHNSVQTEVADLAASARGTAYSMHAFFFFMGQAFGPLLFGPLHLWVGPLWTLMAMACLLLAAALLGGALMRRRMISGILGS
jgi:predicted MFS family arabinose efflux permease